MSYFDPGDGNFVMIEGQIVERDALNIAERIKEYDPNLELLYLDPAMASEISDAPFIVCERLEDGRLVRVFEAWELDNRILERIYSADQHRHSFNALARIDEINAAVKAASERRYKEKLMENHDITQHVLRTKKSKYTFEKDGKLVTIHDDKPHEVKSLGE